MFIRSWFQSDEKDIESIGCIIPNGYAEVRASPYNPPPNLKKRILAGEDVLAIWFKWENKITLEHLKEQGFLVKTPTNDTTQAIHFCIDDMSPEEIFEFCLYHKVHPAHLVPFDANIKFSLPLPLIELLSEIASRDKQFSANDVCLAKVALSYESMRIKKFIDSEARKTKREGKSTISLAVVYHDVVNSKINLKAIANTNFIYSEFFPDNPKFNTSPIEWASDIALAFEDKAVTDSAKTIDRIKQKIKLCYEEIGIEYNAFFCPTQKSDMDVPEFVEGVKFQLAIMRKELGLVKNSEVGRAIRVFKRDIFRRTDSVFAVRCDKYIETEGYNIEHHLRQLDAEDVAELAATVKALFDAERELMLAIRKHEQIEGHYITRTAEINSAFTEFTKNNNPIKKRILANHIFLMSQNISGDIIQVSPK